MQINLVKCYVGNTEAISMGFCLNPEGHKPGKDKLRAVEKAKISETKGEFK